MAKNNPNVPALGQLAGGLKSSKLLPVYFFFGVDLYSLNAVLELIGDTIKPYIDSEFDNETFYGQDKTLQDILNFATAFPFGSGKKFIIVKDFEKIKDKKQLVPYIDSPPEFTTLVIIQEGAVSSFETEPYKTLLKKKFVFEAKELKGENLSNWLVNHIKAKGKIMSAENARMLMDIVGENREMLEAQIEKIFIYLGPEKEITLESIKSLSTALKEYSIFDLQDAIGEKNKAKSLKIAFNMLEKGVEITTIINMLTRYFTGLSRINELIEKKIPDQTAAHIVGSHPYYYKNYLNARKRFSDKALFNAAKSLLKADLTVKTTSTDSKTIISLLIAEVLST